MLACSSLFTAASKNYIEPLGVLVGLVKMTFKLVSNQSNLTGNMLDTSRLLTTIYSFILINFKSFLFLFFSSGDTHIN